MRIRVETFVIDEETGRRGHLVASAIQSQSHGERIRSSNSQPMLSGALRFYASFSK